MIYIILGSKLGRFTDVSVSSCQTSDPKCTLTRGTNASIAIKFIPSKYKIILESIEFAYI